MEILEIKYSDFNLPNYAVIRRWGKGFLSSASSFEQIKSNFLLFLGIFILCIVVLFQTRYTFSKNFMSHHLLTLHLTLQRTVILEEIHCMFKDEKNVDDFRAKWICARWIEF